MSDWLDPLREALERAPDPIIGFVRDDDAGWDDRRLYRLLDLFDAYETPIDLAVIPTQLHGELADELRRRHGGAAGRLGLHQHGYSHVNHESQGRKCEFGPSRAPELQYADIARGRELLGSRLGDAVDPFFTPPWNRCTSGTAAALSALGFALLSRDSTATPFGLPELAEVVVQVDWFASRKGTRLTRDELGSLLAERALGQHPLGVMLHHAVMDDAEFDGVEQLVGLLAHHPNVRMRSMAQVAQMTTNGEGT